MACRAAGPALLTLHYLLMAGAIFGCGVRGLPAYYQAVVGVLLAASCGLLWATHLADPGILPRSSSRDPVVMALDSGEGNVPNRSRYTRAVTGVWVRTMKMSEWRVERHHLLHPTQVGCFGADPTDDTYTAVAAAAAAAATAAATATTAGDHYTEAASCGGSPSGGGAVALVGAGSLGTAATKGGLPPASTSASAGAAVAIGATPGAGGTTGGDQAFHAGLAVGIGRGTAGAGGGGGGPSPSPAPTSPSLPGYVPLAPSPTALAAAAAAAAAAAGMRASPGSGSNGAGLATYKAIPGDGSDAAAAAAASATAVAPTAAAATAAATAPETEPLVVHKYCVTCHIWRPERAHHCGVCGACMAHFDHHCGVVGNCVAHLNHRFFATFMLLAQIVALLTVGGCAWRLKNDGFPGARSWSDVETYLLLLLAAVAAYHVFMLGFGAMHCVFLMCDMTTKEMINGFAIFRRNLPCLPGGSRSPARLARAWRQMLLGPVRLRPRAFAAILDGICGHDHDQDPGGTSGFGRDADAWAAQHPGALPAFATQTQAQSTQAQSLALEGVGAGVGFPGMSVPGVHREQSQSWSQSAAVAAAMPMQPSALEPGSVAAPEAGAAGVTDLQSGGVGAYGYAYTATGGETSSGDSETRLIAGAVV